MDSKAVQTTSPPIRFTHDEPSKPQSKPQVFPIVSLIAGGVSGGVEATITYPFELTKTRSQLQSNVPGRESAFRMIQNILKTEGIGAIYTGCSTLVVGTAFKAGVRFFTFDAIKNAISDSSGKLSPSKGILAGMAAGCVESIVAVTPTERIKTALIDDAKGEKKFRGSLHAAKTLVVEKGFQNLYRGLLSTTLKQSATSGVRMGSYNYLRDLAKSYKIKQNTATTFATGAIAGVITVYATQPFDTVKTSAQSAAGAGTREAFTNVLKGSGVRGLWRGSTMRLGRLVLSGGIVFSIYEQVASLIQRTG